MNWSQDDLAAYQERRKKAQHIDSGGTSPMSATIEAGEEKEAVLQAKIERYLREHGLFYHHDRSKSKNAPGLPDLIVAARDSRTLWLELKSKSGRLSEDQKRVRLQLLACGHEWHEVRSYRQFLKIMEEAK